MLHRNHFIELIYPFNGAVSVDISVIKKKEILVIEKSQNLFLLSCI